MQSIEITAKTLDEVKQQAAAKLGVAIDQIEVQVLEETKGLFGKSQIRAKCDVKVAAEAPAPKKAAPKKAAAKPAKETPAPVVEAQPEAAPATDAKKPRRGRKEDAPAKAEAAPAKKEAEESEADTAVATTEDADKLLGILRELITSSNLQVTATVKEISGKYVSITLDGREAAFLVGKHGEVLNALQYLLNIISSRKITPGVRATIDANDYRHRREEALTKLATKIAEQVLARQEEAVLDALPAFERRIVHKALSTISGISTYSEGEEPNRRVVIAPGE